MDKYIIVIILKLQLINPVVQYIQQIITFDIYMNIMPNYKTNHIILQNMNI